MSKFKPPNLPRIAPRGDLLREFTYAGIGRIIDEWEGVEWELSRLFSCILGQPNGGLIQLYGDARIFRERIDRFKIAVDQMFVREPNQALEARYDYLFEALEWGAARRNEVAHCVVLDMRNFPTLRSHMPNAELSNANYMALPPYYAHRKHGDDALPLYGYSRGEMEAISAAAFQMQLEVRSLRHARHPDLWPEELRVP